MFALRAARPSARLVARSTPTSTPEAPTTTPAAESVFFAGKQVPAAEFEARRAELMAAAAAEDLRIKPVDPPTFGELMAFSGPAPEIMNVSERFDE